MLTMPRSLARSFRAVLRHTLGTRSQPLQGWPPIRCLGGEAGLVLQSGNDDVAVRYLQRGLNSGDDIVIPAKLLAEIEGATNEPVTLDRRSRKKALARWSDGKVPRKVEFDLVDDRSARTSPALPRHWQPAAADLLTALDAAARTTAPETARFAVTRIQLRGKAGQIVATDTKQLLIQDGHHFPWSEDLLVPRMLAVGHPEVRDAAPVRIGRTRTHVGVQAGPWTFLLTIADGRFPPWPEIIPRPAAITCRLHVEPQEVDFLVHALPKLPAPENGEPAVTLDMHRQASVRAQGARGGKVSEIALLRSKVEGRPARLCFDRRFWHRALKMGLHDLHVVTPERPVLCRDVKRLYLFMPLTPEAAIPPSANMTRIEPNRSPATRMEPKSVTSNHSSAKPEVQESQHPLPERCNETMATPTQNGRHVPPPTANPAPAANPPARPALLDPLAEVEALRNSLQDALARCQRLHAVLRQQRRMTRTVRQAVESLRQLPMHP